MTTSRPSDPPAGRKLCHVVSYVVKACSSERFKRSPQSSEHGQRTQQQLAIGPLAYVQVRSAGRGRDSHREVEAARARGSGAAAANRARGRGVDRAWRVAASVERRTSRSKPLSRLSVTKGHGARATVDRRRTASRRPWTLGTCFGEALRAVSGYRSARSEIARRDIAVSRFAELAVTAQRVVRSFPVVRVVRPLQNPEMSVQVR